METWQFVSPYVRRPLSFSSLLCSATFRAPGCQFPDMSLVLAWFVPKTEHVLNLEGSRFHFFFCGHCKICCIFLPFYFWLPLQDMLHLNFLAPLLFFLYHCKICCILDFGRLLPHAASKLHYSIKLINSFSTPLHVFYGEISYSTLCFSWRNLLLNSVHFMARSQY